MSSCASMVWHKSEFLSFQKAKYDTTTWIYQHFIYPLTCHWFSNFLSVVNNAANERVYPIIMVIVSHYGVQLPILGYMEVKLLHCTVLTFNFHRNCHSIFPQYLFNVNKIFISLESRPPKKKLLTM